ncbi:MAG: PHP domain-containing protein [Armatimonadota bacterium]
MQEQKCDVIWPLDGLTVHAENEYLDTILTLPPVRWSGAQPLPRRIWMLAPAGEPVLTFDTVTLRPRAIHAEGPVRWLDYGVAEIPTSYGVYLRVNGLSPSNCQHAHLVISAHLDLSPAGGTLADAERAMLGLARDDAGSTALWPNRVEVGRPVTFTVQYTAGPVGLPFGARVRFTVPRSFSWPQTDDPAAPGYLEVVASDCALAPPSIAVGEMSHEKVEIIFGLQEMLPAGGRITLRYQTAQTYIFASRWAGEAMPHWYSLVPVLTASVSTGPDTPWVWLAPGNGHTVEFLPGPATRLHLFLPGRRHTGVPLVLRGTLTDRYRNAPLVRTPLEVTFTLAVHSVNGESVLPIEGCRWTNHRFMLSLPSLSPGVYRLVTHHRVTGEVMAVSNPLEVMAADDPRQPLFWGEIHTHSAMSDGCGDYAELYRHARDEGAMDFVSAADHLSYFSDNDWLGMQDTANAFNGPGCFCALIGYEWGYHCIYTADDRLQTLRTPHQNHLPDLLAAYRGNPRVVAGPHALLEHHVTWGAYDPSVQCFLEIYSTWGANDRRDSPLVRACAAEQGSTANEILRQGAKLGFTGGGDIHCGRPGFSNEAVDGQGTVPHDLYFCHLYRDGMTAAVMPRLHREALIQALRDRRTYATTGARILLDVTLGGLAMGEEGVVDAPVCRVTVHAVSDLAAIHIIKDGAVAWSTPVGGLDAEVTWTVPVLDADEHYYYVNVVQADGEMAWSSPIWACFTQREVNDDAE